MYKFLIYCNIMILLSLPLTGCFGWDTAEKYNLPVGQIEIEAGLSRSRFGVLYKKNGNKFVLEAELYQSYETEESLYFSGFTGFTIVDRHDGKITQYRRNEGKGSYFIGTNKDILQENLGTKYISVDKYTALSAEARKIFEQRPAAYLRLGGGFREEQTFRELIRIIEIDNDAKRLIDLQNGAMLDINILKYQELNEKMYCEGELFQTILDYETSQITQKIKSEKKSMTNSEKRVLTYFRTEEGSLKNYQLVDTFSDEDEKIFLEMK
jgi:hypothetical protein